MTRIPQWLWMIPVALVCVTAKVCTERRLSGFDERTPSLYLQSARYHAASLQRYSLGFENVVADLIWLRLLDKARQKDPEPGKVTWEFAQLDAITALDRNFERAYIFGAAFLSVYLRDNLGARLILEKWVRYFPVNWKAHYTLGYHLYFEMGEFKPAATRILAAAAMEGAPSWLSSLGIRLLTQTGSLAQALRMAISLYPALKEGEGQKRLTLRIRSLIYNLQKASWQAALASFRAEEHREPSSLTDIVPYLASKNREIASMLSNSEMPDRLRPLFAENHAFRYDLKEKQIVPLNPSPDLEKIGVYRPEGT